MGCSAVSSRTTSATSPKTQSAAPEANLRTAKPVFALPGVEHHLQHAEAEGEKADAPQVDATGLVLADVVRIVHEGADHHHGDHADRQVEVEDPAPGIVVGDPAAERGAEDGREDDAQSKGRHGRAVLLGWKRLQQDGLRQGLQSSAGEALQDAEEDQRFQAGGHAAQQRGHSESDDAREQHVATSEAVGQPSRHGQDDGVGDEVGGHHPGAFFDGGAHVPGDVGNGDVDHRGVEDLHERRQHDGDSHDPRIDGAPGFDGVHDATQREIIETPAGK